METIKNAGSAVYSYIPGVGSSAEQKFDAMSEDQKKETFDNLPTEQKKGKQTYTEWIAAGYHKQYENWMPWIEDLYLKWFSNDNKASYAAKDTLDKSKVTGIEQVDNLQDGVNNLAAGQVGKGGLLQPVGDMASKEGVNRAERGGKDESGSYGGPAAAVTDPAVNASKAGGEQVTNAAGGVGSYAKSAGGYVSGLWGGGKKE